MPSFKTLDDLNFSIAVEILAEFARTRHLAVTPMTAVQLFIAADALDVEGARYAFIRKLVISYLCFNNLL